MVKTNAVLRELQEAKRGYGLHTRSVQRANNMENVREALGIAPNEEGSDLDSALELRESLAAHIAAHPTLTDDQRVLLACVLNYEDRHTVKLSRRRDLGGAELSLGTKARGREEDAATQIIAASIAKLAKDRAKAEKSRRKRTRSNDAATGAGPN